MLVLLTLSLVALLYLRGWYKLRAAFPGVLQIWRPAAFVGGLVILFAATGSPLAMLDHHSLTAHMAQHLLIMTVAAPLILMGGPVITLLHAIPPGFSGWFDRRPKLGSVITHPVFCWLACTAVVIGWHIPALFDVGMRSELAHMVEQSSFLIAGILFWWPVIRPWPSASNWPVWAMPVYLFLATLPCDALSAYLCFCNRAVYAHYLGTSALSDQARAGALMWFWATFAYLIPAAALAYRMLSPENRLLEKQVV